MKVAFVTNRPAHYRVPIFQLLSRSIDVDFYFTATKSGRWWTPEHDDRTEDLHAAVGTTPIGLLRAIGRRGSYDCVVASLSGRSHLAATAAAVESGRHPFVLWIEMWAYPRSPVHAAGRPLVRHLLRHADAVVAGGLHVVRWLSEEAKTTGPIFVLRNPVDNALFGQVISASNLATTRLGFGLEVDAIACFVGRLEREKGLPLLLNALARVGSNIGLVIVGSGSCGGHVRSLASELGIAHRVRTIGWVSQRDLPVYYQACDFLVLPSVSTPLVRETWGLVANEAMVGGLPVLASDAVGAAAGGLIEDGVTGLVVPERDIGALTVALTKLGSDSALRTRLGAAARERAETFTFEGAAETFTEAIQHAVMSRRRC